MILPREILHWGAQLGLGDVASVALIVLLLPGVNISHRTVCIILCCTVQYRCTEPVAAKYSPCLLVICQGDLLDVSRILLWSWPLLHLDRRPPFLPEHRITQLHRSSLRNGFWPLEFRT